MRRIKLEEWCKEISAQQKEILSQGKPKAVKRKPTSEQEFINSIIYIKMRDEYLQNEGILVKIGKRRYRFNIKNL